MNSINSMSYKIIAKQINIAMEMQYRNFDFRKRIKIILQIIKD